MVVPLPWGLVPAAWLVLCGAAVVAGFCHCPEVGPVVALWAFGALAVDVVYDCCFGALVGG